MNKSQRFILSVLLFSFLLVPVRASAETQVSICINGYYVIFSEEFGYPYISKENRTMVPLAVTMQEVGADVSWDQASSTAKVVE